MSVFKASGDLNVEGTGQIITREPGIYQMALETLTAGTKRTGTGDNAVDIPTIDVNLVVKKVVKLHKPEAHNAGELIGKKHTDQVKLNATDQKSFDTMVTRLAHQLTKAGIAKEAILAVELASLDAKGWAKYQKDIIALFDPAKHNTIFNYKIVGGVFSGSTFTGATGYVGFAAPLDKELKFSSDEIKKTNDYYSAINGSTPAPDGATSGSSGGGAVAGAAF